MYVCKLRLISKVVDGDYRYLHTNVGSESNKIGTKKNKYSSQ